MNHKRGVAAVLLAVGAIVVGGCGGGDGGDGGGEELGEARLAERAGAICAKYSKQAEDLGNPSTADPRKAEDYFNRARDLAQKQQDELSALNPADGVQEDFDTLVDVSQDATDLLGDLATAAGEQDREAGAELLQRLQPVSESINEAANAIGAEECASP